MSVRRGPNSRMHNNGDENFMNIRMSHLVRPFPAASYRKLIGARGLEYHTTTP